MVVRTPTWVATYDRLIRYYSRRLAELGQKVTVEPLPEVTPGEGMVNVPSPCQS